MVIGYFLVTPFPKSAGIAAGYESSARPSTGGVIFVTHKLLEGFPHCSFSNSSSTTSKSSLISLPTFVISLESWPVTNAAYLLACTDTSVFRVPSTHRKRRATQSPRQLLRLRPFPPCESGRSLPAVDLAHCPYWVEPHLEETQVSLTRQALRCCQNWSCRTEMSLHALKKVTYPPAEISPFMDRVVQNLRFSFSGFGVL